MYDFLITFLLLIASIIAIEIPMPISDSGFLTVNLTELLNPAIAFFLFIQMFRKKYKVDRKLYLILKTVILFLIGYIVIFILRWMKGYEYKQSLLTVKVVLLPLVFLFLYNYRKFQIEYLVDAFILFSFVINMKLFFNVENIRMVMFLGNILVPLSIIILLLPMNYYFIIENKRKSIVSIILFILASLNIMMTIVFSVLVGSRTCIGAAIFVSAFCLILAIGKKEKHFFSAFFITIAAILILFIIWLTNVRGLATYMYRTIPPASDIAQSQEQVELRQEALEITLREKRKSDISRFSLWRESIKSIEESPIIGKGIVYFTIAEVENKTFAAHNFILEYINSFGIPLAVIALSIYFYTFKTKWKKEFRNQIYIRYCGISFMGILMISFFQPTLMNVSIMMILWIYLASAFNM